MTWLTIRSPFQKQFQGFRCELVRDLWTRTGSVFLILLWHEVPFTLAFQSLAIHTGFMLPGSRKMLAEQTMACGSNEGGE